MTRYYFNKNTDSKGNHEVHTGSCSYLPSEENRDYIGSYDSCSDAIKAAKKHIHKSPLTDVTGVVDLVIMAKVIEHCLQKCFISMKKPRLLYFK